MPGGENRLSKRKPFKQVAAMDFGDGLVMLPCEIGDISEGGARLIIFTEPEQVPDRFSLLLSPAGNVRRACKTVWRSSGQIGVQFVKAK